MHSLFPNCIHPHVCVKCTIYGHEQQRMFHVRNDKHIYVASKEIDVSLRCSRRVFYRIVYLLVLHIVFYCVVVFLSYDIVTDENAAIQ